MLCDVCTRMFSSGIDFGDHHTSLVSFIKAAADGCYICTPLWNYATERGPLLGPLAHGPMHRKYFIDRGENCLPASLHLAMLKGIETDNPLEMRSFSLVRRSTLPVAGGVRDRQLTIPVAESLLAAQKWMSTCLNEHEQCHKQIQTHTYPTRILELRNHEARLILPRGDQPLGPYAALSYCWGSDPKFIRLTADNLQEFRLGLPYSDLPIAFQEAIHIIKELGIRYVWIDALCIIQSGLGSSEDWQSECVRMQDVYSNCTINFSLAQATHPDQSCLGGYTFDSTLPFEADIVETTRGPKETHTYTVMSHDYFKEALYGQPIGCRAWVLQERLLATRVLSIGHGELFWDCQQAPHASESLPVGFTLCSDIWRDYLSSYIGLSIHSIPETSNSESLEEIWAKILMEYTARELTYPQVDKLMALSAISTRMSYAMNDTYLGGHFRKSLPQSLNWRAHREATPRLRAKERDPKRLRKFSSQTINGDWIITPSWSWASMDGRLHAWMTTERSLTFDATMEACEIFPVAQTGPEARVENMLLLTIRTRCQVFDWKTIQPSINNGLKIILEGGQDMLFVIDDMHDLPDDRSECLLATLGHYQDRVEGLLLREIVISEGSKMYERLGHFIWSTADLDENYRDWTELFAHGECSITLC